MDSAKPRLTATFAISVFAISIGVPFLQGYNLGVTNPPERILKDFVNKSLTLRNGVEPDANTVTNTFAFMVSSLCIGGLMGAAFVAPVSKKFGRKNGILFDTIFAVTGLLCMYAAESMMSHELLIAGRFLAGIHVGLGAGLAPLYFSEISPLQWRGAVGTIYQLVVVMAILVSQILGLNQYMGNEEWWTHLIGGAIICPIIMLALIPFCPESPKFLLGEKNDERAAEIALRQLRGVDDVSKELKEMSLEAEAARNQPTVTLSSVLKDPVPRKALVVCVMVMLAQPLSGINAVIFFSTSIFKTANLSENAAGIATVVMSLVNLLSTASSMVLIEKSGRKILLLTGILGMVVCSSILTLSLGFVHVHALIAWIPVGAVMAFVFFFAIGPGSIPWFLPTELFAPPAQPIAGSICVATNWGFNIAVGMIFPILHAMLGHYVFLVFAGLLSIFYIYIFMNLPETKGKSLDEVSAKLSAMLKKK